MFSGIGGFEKAAVGLGHIVVGHSEIDKYADSIYSRWYHNKNYGDATKINPEELPDFDILFAGFPCQPFSIMGTRSVRDTRGTLFHEIIRIAAHKRPRYMLLENVKGLLSSQNGKTYKTILTEMDAIGYDCQWELINHKPFVPQNRQRVFIVCHLRGYPRPKVFPLQYCPEINGETRKEKQGNGQRFRCTPDTANTIDASYYKGWGGGRSILVYNENKKRVFTPLECERLMGFPDYYTNGISDTQRYKCLGNAVSPPVVHEILKRLMPHNYVLGGGTQ